MGFWMNCKWETSHNYNYVFDEFCICFIMHVGFIGFEKTRAHKPNALQNKKQPSFLGAHISFIIYDILDST